MTDTPKTAALTQTKPRFTGARDCLVRGAEAMSNAVKVTLGPEGHNVLLERRYGAPYSTRHGVSVALAALACVLSACMSEPAPAPRLAAVAVAPPPAKTPAPSFQTMREALPAFDLVAGSPTSTSQREVSVVRDLFFPVGDSFLTRDQVSKLAPLISYLRTNPSVAVRIEAYGDGTPSDAQDTDLARSRAQAIARALLTDMRVANRISTGMAVGPLLQTYNGTGKVTFLMP